VSLPGWYPDPARTPGRFRYWDGQSWSAVTTTDPGDPPPRSVAPSPRRRGWLLGTLAVGLVLIIVAIFVVRAVIVDSAGVSDDPLPTSPVSGGDDRSPTPTPTPSDPSRTATPRPSAATSAPLVDCPIGDPSARQEYPADGRIHGGDLSFPAQPGWNPTQHTSGLSWAYDVDGQQQTIEPNWFAMFAVGALSVADGFDHPSQAAEAVMQCTATSGFYEGFTERKDLHAKAITVDGRPGWSVRSEIYVETDQTTLPGDVVDVVVVDLGAPEALAMFWGAVPIGDRAMIGQLDRVIGELRPG